MPSFYPLLVPLAPLIAALFTTLPHRYSGDRNYKIGGWLMFVGFVASLLLLWQAIQSPEPTHLVLFAVPWKVIPAVELTFDRLAAVMLTVISGFGALLYSYSTRYLQQDGGQRRYLALLALKVSIQLFMVASADLLTLFICWQLLGWLLSLLAHNYAHVPTANGAFRTFIMLRAGDLAFMAGIALAFHLYGTVQLTPLFERAAADQTILSFFGTGLGISGATAVTLLIFFGAMCKSVQFPMHMWLLDSLYAPTPIHALLHAGGINAGGFLLCRLAPLFVLSPATLHVALIIGLITAVLGSSMMLVQNDIKKTLGYSTIGQMGYMIMECGLGAFSLAVFHLVAHGLFKANVFLNCGKGIQEARMHPVPPPQPSASKSSLGLIGWIWVFVLSLVVPLGMTVAAHALLGIPFENIQGLLILMLFSWVTVSQAVLTLFRLEKTLLTKGMMLLLIGLVATIYFFAAEQFTHFLFPDPNVVAAQFQAAELPHNSFLPLSALLILSIATGWFFSVYRQQIEKVTPAPKPVKVNTYLLFMNRLYLDGIAMRLFGTLKRIGGRINQSPAALVLVIILAFTLAWSQTAGLAEVPLKTFALLLLPALLVPLFPFHGIYIAALTKAPRALATALCVLLPVLGLFAMIGLSPQIPGELLPAIRVLAVIGALWGTLKAFLQVRASCLLAYGGLALYSILWWDFAQTGQMTPHVLTYAWTLTIAWGGLFLAWDRVRVRYGDLDLNRIGGLFQPMPHFALCMGVLVMAAVGLPPFGLFFGYLGILLSPSTGISPGLAVIIATWFASCWYLFRLMQQLLFGPYRQDLRYEDLRPAEVLVFAFVIALLVMPGVMPQDWQNTVNVAFNIERMPWIQ